MHLRLRYWLTLALLSVFLLPAHATRYEISLREDRVAADGQCSIREAVEAINTQETVNECPAGDGRERIILDPGGAYEFTQGELVIGGQATDDKDNLINPQVRFVLQDGLDASDENAVLDFASSDSRAFTVSDNSKLTLADMTIKNGSAANSPGGNGGIVWIKPDATLDLRSKTRLDGGIAEIGGLIYAEDATIEMTDDIHLLNGKSTLGDGGGVFLKGNTSLTAQEVAFDHNQAAGSGGGLALDTDFSGPITISKSHFGDNEAEGGMGGGLFLQGENVSFIAANTTVASNVANSGAGGLGFEQPTSNQTLRLNNLTFANNSSATGSGTVDIEGAASDDLIINSVIVGDRTADDCSGIGITNVTRKYNVMGSGCPHDGEGHTDATVNTTHTIEVLRNDNGNCPDAPPDPGCEQASLKPFDGYLPATGIAPTALGAGNPTEQGQNSCISEDQRSVSRLEQEQCDAGSIQFEKAAGMEDEERVVWGKMVELDVVENDLGDSDIDCSRVPAGEACAEILLPPDRPDATASFEIDSSGYPIVMYSPGERYHGLDRFAYRVHKDAFNVTKGEGDIEAVTNVVSEPASGLEESDSIDQIGSFPGVGIGIILVLGLVRRYAWSALLLVFSSTAAAVEIPVTSLEDNINRGDGVCTLREAIISARDETVNREPACEDGADGRDTILLPRGCITMDPGLGPFSIDYPLTIKGKGAHGVDLDPVGSDPDPDLPDLSGAECAPNDDSNPDWTEGTIIRAAADDGEADSRIINNQALLDLVDLSLMYGNASGNGGALRTNKNTTLRRVEFYKNRSAQSGGAIYLVGIAGERQELTVRRGYFRENEAGKNGGAIAMAATGHDIEVFDSTFEANEATERGGGVNMAITRGVSWIVNTTMLDNVSGTGAGALDLQQVARDPASENSGTPSVNLVNNTIVDNNGSGPGGINVGADQDGTGDNRERDFRLSNSVLANNSDNSCYSGASPQPFDQFVYNLVSNDADAMSSCFSNDDQSNNSFRDDIDIRDSLASQTEYTEGEQADNFVAPNLEVLGGGPVEDDIVDSGDDSALASNNTTAAALCRPRDVRGFTRASGNACDRGAYEVQETTAQNDSTNNVPGLGNRIFINVLQNDSTDPVKYEVDPETIDPIGASVTPLPSGQMPGIEVVYQDFPGVKCGDEQGLEEARAQNPRVDFDEDDFNCVVLYDVLYEDPLEQTGDPNEVTCDDLPIRKTQANGSPAFDYEFFARDENGNLDPDSAAPASEKFNSAKVYLNIDNVAPRINSEVVLNEPGEKRVIDLRIRDNFGPEGVDIDQDGDVDLDDKIKYESLELVSDPQFADVDENGNVVGTGIKLNAPKKGQITYVPRDKTKTFTDRFEVRVSDECGEESRRGQIVIRYNKEDTSGGELLGGGSSGMVGLVVLVGLGGLRRRFRA